MLTHSQYSSIANRIKIEWKPSFFSAYKRKGLYCYGRSMVGEVRYNIGFYTLDSVSLVFSSPQEVFYKKLMCNSFFFHCWLSLPRRLTAADNSKQWATSQGQHISFAKYRGGNTKKKQIEKGIFHLVIRKGLFLFQRLCVVVYH